MIKYDNELRSIPHIPFIIEIPNVLCYIVEIPMTKAAQDEYLKYFKSIEIDTNHSKEQKTKLIGYKCLKFHAFCSKFEINGGAVMLRFQPYNWTAKRVPEHGGVELSIDKNPATGREAMEIYFSYKTQSKQDKVNQIVDDLKNNRIRTDYIKNNFPSFYEDYKRSKNIDTGIDFSGFEIEVVRQSLEDLPAIKRDDNASKRSRKQNNKGSHDAHSSFDLLISYLHILERQIECDEKKNKRSAMKEALLLFYPNIPDDELPVMVDSLIKKADRNFKGNKCIEYLFPNIHY